MKTIKTLLASYNGEKYIEEQIQSILNQEGVLVDLIINDDSSKDRTVALVKEKFPELKVKINTPATGSAANNFLKMITEIDFNEDFHFVAFADQDDIWLPQKLSAAVEKLEAENAALYCSNLTKWDMQNNSFFLLKKDYPQKKYDFLFEGGSAGCTYVFTKNLAQQLKAFIPTVDSSCWEEFSHDWLVYFFARSRGFKVCIDGNSYIHYRLHNNNVHGHLNQLSFSTIKYKIGKVLRGYHKKHIENYIKYIEPGSDYYKIYRAFLGSYFQRNKMILKYNTQLMRDTKKFYLFLLLNLFRFK
ncbi:glycosyltransferase [Bergeyella cardium]|uniref:Glycosyltransferase n=1 Tax=Bergeyella cardium TaxID=1585976 RepID=A0A6P1QUM5_9FLAO|nr:glycosyltransferase [Bergeyella cardium]QHN65852.1 glycosyltransferase [Bergeyella cardium]WHE33454.1 glycosyltransferase [Bergeyella cardium]WHF60104.1 glycosyltransferase [Bergeyella cardium]